MGLMMIAAGISHLTFKRKTFQVQVPDFVPMPKDVTVVASGIVEILFGLAMIFSGNKKNQVGLILAIFYVLVFPGNIHQYQDRLDGFGLDTDRKRFARLFMQPVLIFFALYSTGGHRLLKSNDKQ